MSSDLLQRLEPYREAAENHLAANLVSEVPAIQQIGQYILLSGGKRLRPILYLLSLGLCNGSAEDHGRFSSIFEFMHGASLLHDDVIDEADVRRGQEAAHQRWPNRVVVLVGDHLFGQAFALSAETGIPEFVRVLSQCTADLAAGQVLEAQHQGELNPPRRVYLDIITAKTAVLLAAAVRCGSIIAGASEEQVAAMGRFGLDVGVAFQIIDDVLDWAGDEAVVGKPLGQDIREGKATLPWLEAVEAADEEAKKEMRRLACQGRDISEIDWTWLKGEIDRLGGNAAALAEAERLKDRAKEALSIFPDRPEKQLLLDVADYVCRRRL